MSNPVRIQRKRTKGWKMPPNTVYVGRPGPWGNPYQVDEAFTRDGSRLEKPWWVEAPHSAHVWTYATKEEAVAAAVALFRETMTDKMKERAKVALRGKNLACFCPLDKPCHADVLLELANAPTVSKVAER